MKINSQLPLQRLIGKIDNDFNLSESDWIPRVAAWTIDALSQLKVLPMEFKTRELEVCNKVAQFPCDINPKSIEVYDSYGCRINQLTKNNSCGCNSPQEIAVYNPYGTDGASSSTVVRLLGNSNHNFVLDGNNIELNFDTDKIVVKSYEVATYYDEYYDCDVPYIYDNGLLLEALAWYCLFKYLSRGSKHPVYDLKSNSPVTNPYLHWNELKRKAAISVKNDIAGDRSGWNNFFYNSTFLPRG